MLDMTMTPRPGPAWAETLQRGDIVLFRFPYAEADARETPKSRTCLVLETGIRDGQHRVTLAYGTSAHTRANVGSEIHIATAEDMRAAGVRKLTRIVCDRRITVTPDDPGWDIHPRHASPVIGRLSPRGRAEMEVIRARLAPRPDRAAARAATAGRPFAVEHRRRRRLMARPVGGRA
jgi:hypothetical protein